MSLYGHSKDTTPYLEKWAKKGLVFDNCISVANCTVPSHASMFTGFMPSEHGLKNTKAHLNDSFKTVAELLKDSGYQTYLFSANPHIGKENNFIQGFDLFEHPWSQQYAKRACSLLIKKVVAEDKSNDLPIRIKSGAVSSWEVSACGELAQDSIEKWLAGIKRNRPFFAFLNYMEAHQPYLPSRAHREKIMSPEQIQESYNVDRSWNKLWSYSFGLKEYMEEEIELTRLTYDAALLELDELFERLMVYLEDNGYMDNTVVILTSDHGEHLGEKHMLDHQHSVYEPLARVPMIIRYPKQIPSGRSQDPVMNYDLFPTVLGLAGIEMPIEIPSKAISLFNPHKQRKRIMECLDYSLLGVNIIKRLYPEFNPTPWQRKLRAVYEDHYKYIWTSDNKSELYDLEADPDEVINLINVERETVSELIDIHKQWISNLKPIAIKSHTVPLMTEEQRKRLESLGYVGSKK